MSEYRIFETDEFKKSNKALAQKRGRSLDKKLTDEEADQIVAFLGSLTDKPRSIAQ